MHACMYAYIPTSTRYGPADLHDANRGNNANNLPVMLDFDNFSGDEDTPDDIRRLASWPNNTRTQFVQTLWHTARLYNPRVTVSVPLSKAAGGNWPLFRQPQPQCWSGTWGKNDGLYFGVVSCGLANLTSQLFAEPDHPSVEQVRSQPWSQRIRYTLPRYQLPKCSLVTD